MKNLKSTIIVPCYNEATRLPKEKFLKFAEKEKNYKFLFVDDGSQDRTYQVLELMKRKSPEYFDVLKLEVNGGKAEAVRQGVGKALEFQNEIIGFWDADLATPLEELPFFLDVFKERPDIEVVIGSRVKLLGHNIERNALRHYLGRVFATFASMVLAMGVYDTQCGAKLFRRTKNLEGYFENRFISKWIFDVEILARFSASLKNHGGEDKESKIYELPLSSWHDIAGSKLRPGDFFTAFIDLFRIFLHYR